MDPIQLINAIHAAAKLTQSLVGLADQVQDVLSSDDDAEITEALKELRGVNDALHARVQQKLRNV